MNQDLEFIDALEETIIRVMQGESPDLFMGFQIGLECVRKTVEKAHQQMD